VVVVVPDLFFAARIDAAAKALEIRIIETSAAEAPTACRAELTHLVLLDLHAPGAIELVRALKRDPETAAIPVVGFYSHVETATFRAATEAGIDRALARSAFTTLLPDILRGGAESR
jgi:CheY-like chemotaxis protein